MQNKGPILQKSRLGILIFQLGNLNLALPLKEVVEILPMAELLQPPGGLPSVLEGILNLGGLAVPVVRFERLFRIPDQKRELYTPVIVLRSSPPLALLVSAVHSVIEVDADSLLPLEKKDFFNECIDGELKVQGTTVFLISLQRILLKKEQELLGELQQSLQRRMSQWNFQLERVGNKG